MEPKRENLSVFGGATNMPSFGRQGSLQLNLATSSVFGGSFVFGNPAAIGQASNSTMNTASQVFGTPAAIGQVSNFTTGSASQVFGTPAAMGQASNFTTGSASQVFGTHASMGQAYNSTTNTSSQVFGTPGSSSSSNLFGTNQSSIFVSSNNQPSSNPFSVGTCSISSLPIIGQSLFAPSVVSVQTAASESNNLTTPSPFSAESSNVFGSFSQNSTSGSPTSGSVFGKLSSSGFKNTGSSESFGGSNLFSKQETKSTALFGFNTSSTSQPFVVKPSSPAKTASSLFTGAVSSSSNTALTFPSDNQPGNSFLFGQKHSNSSIMGPAGKSVNLQPEFSNIKSSEHAQTAESVYKVINPVEDSVSSIQASKIPAITSHSASSNTLFGDIAPSGSIQSQERDSSDGLFKKSAGRLFGKPVQDSGAVFGKVSGSQDTTDKSQASSPPKSLSKWSRGKLFPDRKRREDTDSRTDYERDAKKSKFFETGQIASTSGLPLRSSLRLSSVDDQLKTSLVVRDIPAHLNRVSVLRRHFSRFGTITRLQPLPMKKAANITFKTHNEAMAAKNDGKHISPDDPPMAIFWRAGSKLKSPDTKGNQVRDFKKESVSLKRKPVPGSVEDELTSMSELSPDFQQGTFSKVSKLDLPKVTAARKKSPTPPPAPQLQDVDVAKGHIVCTFSYF